VLFNSLDYILFLGIAVAGFWLLARHAQLRIIFVFVASCLFYMAWHPAYIVLILGSTVVDYIVGLRIHATDRPRARKRWLILSLVSNLGLLGLFKYFNFASQATADVLGLFFGIEIASPPFLDVLLPVGISFYTFQTLSYTIDIYRRKLEPTRNFFQFAFFVTYFPQLVAGPIVRASQLLPQLQRKITLRDEQVTQGLFLIASGMVKKVVIADYLSVNLVDRVFDQPELYSAAEVVIALYGFTMQIYCDFSGYTDVARGSAKLMGLELPENFDRPYQSASPAEFWRRWHITLSTWLRDYLLLEPVAHDVPHRHLARRILDVRFLRHPPVDGDGDSSLLLSAIGPHQRHGRHLENARVQGFLGASVCGVLEDPVPGDRPSKRG
jgi:D-alanyl-lipoteichoic acid acyltransferase DltB (MBOAT superfamily)